jgi:hypothetical protein
MIKKLKTMPYAQAHIEIHDDTYYLFSYVTLVATVRYEDGEKWIKCYGLYSSTTRKHISAFAKEHDLQFTDFKEIAGCPFEMNMMTGEILTDGE